MTETESSEVLDDLIQRIEMEIRRNKDTLEYIEGSQIADANAEIDVIDASGVEDEDIEVQ